MDRFWSRVMVGSPDQCWLWTGTRIRGGYGQSRFHGKCVTTHRIAYILTHGAIPAGMDILHSCDNPPCCNPAHLRAGTAAENMAEASAKGRMARGEKSPQAKLSDADVAAIRSSSRPLNLIAKDYGVTPQYIGQLKSGLWRTKPTQQESYGV